MSMGCDLEEARLEIPRRIAMAWMAVTKSLAKGT
jgi:hypothetical protein